MSRERADADADRSRGRSRNGRRSPGRQRSGGHGVDRPGRREDGPAAEVQRRLGNRAVQRLAGDAGSGQVVASGSTLTVNDPDDRYEREAERVADRIVSDDAGTADRRGAIRQSGGVSVRRSGAAGVQRMCSRCQRRHREGKPLNCPECESELRRKAEGGANGQTREAGSSEVSRAVGDDAAAAVESARTGGRPLPPGTRSFFEERMGHGFGDVRVHTGARADAAARAVRARAFTLGRDVVFRAGAYRPGTRDGTRLLAHELTHVVQQTGGRSAAVPGSRSRGPKSIQRQDEPTPAEQSDEPAEKIKPGVSVADACVQTTGSGSARRSASSFDARYAWESAENETIDHAEIYLHKRGSNAAIRSKTVKTNRGTVTFGAGITIDDENAKYQLRVKLVRKNGSARFAGSPEPVRFQVCELEPKPSGVNLKFAKMLYAEGSDAGEFPWVRDIVYNRIDWVNKCKADVSSFGKPNINAVLTHPNQFASVLNQTPKFKELETELDQHAGKCEYTTSPRSTSPARCRLVNAAVRAVANGKGNTHNYVFFRSDTKTPSRRAVNRGHYPGGNYYWEIKGCPGKSGSGSPDAGSGSPDAGSGSTD